MQRLMLAWLAVVSLCGCGGAERPNIVLIVSDDHGWPDYGFMGAEVVRTPRLDSLAAEGTVFTHAFNTSSVCEPSLRSLLTGLHPMQSDARLAALRADGLEIPRNSEILYFATLPSRLADAGYPAFQGGKYWEGTYDLAGFTHGMTSEDSRHDPALAGRHPVLRRAGGAALALGRETMQPLWDFMESQGSGPFFVWFAPMLPHTPHDAPEHFSSLYTDERIPERVRGYYANVTRFDELVGDVIDWLEAHDLRRRTLVVVLSDNGWDARSHVQRSAYGGSEGKLSIRELGIRTPLIVSWPGRIPADVSDPRLVSTVDLVATLLDYADAEPLPHRPGKTLRPYLEGTAAFPRQQVFGAASMLRNPRGEIGMRGAARIRASDAEFVRTANWRFVRGSKQRDRGLYRIADDPFEEHDLRLQRPRVVAMLEPLLEAWHQRMLVHWGRLPAERDTPARR